jgi:hypothetical protein
MKLLRMAVVTAAVCSCAAVATAAEAQLKPFFAVLPVTRSVALPEGQARTLKPLPSFAYSVNDKVALKTYKGTILGGSPSALTKTSTTLPLQVVPMIVTITGVGTFDPTKVDSCNHNLIETSFVAGSPLFSKSHVWTLNGIKVGQTQYIDAFQRAEFWSEVKNTNYHVLFSQSQLASQKKSFIGAEVPAVGCTKLGAVDINTMDKAVQSIITKALATNINVGTLPLFLLRNVVMDVNNNVTQCCIIGYHSGLLVGGKLQVYSVSDVDSTGDFQGLSDIAALSHELGEAANDPTTNNPTARWGHTGQVTGCQTNLEVGDPLSGPKFPELAITLSGNTYHLQELAFFSWFYHQKPSLGAGGYYSDNKSFKTFAAKCT